MNVSEILVEEVSNEVVAEYADQYKKRKMAVSIKRETAIFFAMYDLKM